MTDVVVVEFNIAPIIVTGDGSTSPSLDGGFLMNVGSQVPKVSVRPSDSLPSSVEYFANTNSLNGTLKLEGKVTFTWPGDGTVQWEAVATLTAITACTLGSNLWGIGPSMFFEFAGPATVEVRAECDEHLPGTMTAGQVLVHRISGTVAHS